jgi:hypothetical protein
MWMKSFAKRRSKTEAFTIRTDGGKAAVVTMGTRVAAVGIAKPDCRLRLNWPSQHSRFDGVPGLLELLSVCAIW